jgi:hypothetical protein
MHKEGFQYISYVKGLYYDGHDQPDVVKYWQNHEEQLVKYVVGEVAGTPQNYVECHSVLVPHNETTSQANDGHHMGGVLKQQFPLQIKGMGQGLHKSGTICRTVGYLKEGRQTLEYGKN